MVQCGSIISANIYRTADAPKYKHGNKILIAVNVLAIALFIYAKAYYVIKNKARDKKWNALTIEVRLFGIGWALANAPQQQQDYIRNTKLRGSRRLDFRFAH